MAKTTVADIRKRLRHKSAALVEFMRSPIGKSIVEALEEEFFNGEIFDPDPYKTAFNCGQRDVVLYIHQLKNYPSEEIIPPEVSEDTENAT